MHEWNRSACRKIRYPQMLWISYALNKHEAFWKTSRDLICLYTSKELVTVCNELTHGILPAKVLGERSNHENPTSLTLPTQILSVSSESLRC